MCEGNEKSLISKTLWNWLVPIFFFKASTLTYVKNIRQKLGYCINLIIMFWSGSLGMQVLEWNGISLTAKTYEEVQSIIIQQSREAEICVRLWVFPICFHWGGGVVLVVAFYSQSSMRNFDDLKHLWGHQNLVQVLEEGFFFFAIDEHWKKSYLQIQSTIYWRKLQSTYEI